MHEDKSGSLDKPWGRGTGGAVDGEGEFLTGLLVTIQCSLGSRTGFPIPTGGR